MTGIWREAVEAVLGSPGTVVLLGAVDVGKTTTATALANAALLRGLRTAVVDTDTGQSDLGPPATVGWGMLEAPVRRMAEIPLTGMWFIGDTAPQRVYAHLIDGALRLIARARRREAQVIVVDTTGWIEGAAAVAAKVRKIRAIRPRYLVAIQRGREVEPILARLPGTIAIQRLAPSPRVRERSRDERRAFRERRFAAYFARGRARVLDLHRLGAERPVTYGGRRVPPGRVLAEVPPDELRHLLVGLRTRRGDLAALGTILEADPAAGLLRVLAPGFSQAAVSGLQWGVLRVAPSGREDGRVGGAA